MIKVQNLTKYFGEQLLFDSVSFSLSRGERVGLVGRNGSGKSTLFKLLRDEEHPDEGQIVIPKGYKIGHLAQHLKFTEDTILEEACLGLPPGREDEAYKAEIILSGLGFSEDDMYLPPSHFSGGFQIRINLAKVLLSEPNLLLLDEPTNYLDIVSALWLTEFLRNWKNEMIIISHDRDFMDNVTTHTMIIHRKKMKKIQGGTEKLYEQIIQDEEIYEKTRLNEDKKRKDLEQFISRFRAKASKATLVQSRVKMLERMGQKEELQDEETLDFFFTEAPFHGRFLLEAQKLTFGYPDSPDLIKNLSIHVSKTDRIGIIGKNGKGKSTLLRLLAGELQPATGEAKISSNTQVGFFGQTNIDRLTPSLTVEEEITAVNPNLSRTRIRGICGTMMFSGDNALKKNSVLSGGEKSRVLLGKILATPTNLLLLDEPTNHLDMESIEALVESLKEYNGGVILVTHSELLLRALATRLIVFQGDKPFVFEGPYDYFLEKIGWDEVPKDKPTSRSKK